MIADEWKGERWELEMDDCSVNYYLVLDGFWCYYSMKRFDESLKFA